MSDFEAMREQRARQAVRNLSKAHPRMRAIIKSVGPHRPNTNPNAFATLVDSIASQQVSMHAAAAILRRLTDACPRKRVTPAALSAMSIDELRGVGLSRQKASYLHDLAEHFATRRVSGPKLKRLDDEAVIESVTRIRGVGRWTAEMLLMFCLERPDVWPIDDLGLRKAVMRFHEYPEMPGAAVMREAGEIFRPFRSYASWYLWRSLEGPLMPGIRID
ncbi:MAG: DNA-3-methyladenine glycosylase 2 family protein [Phycisphaerales bacterium]|nr:DNA-3-methyladenine glycosylase 2 family protein [Phycisphaerales bacterium]